MRKTSDELKKIANKMECIDIFSWSKLNCYSSDPYTYFLKYILKIPEDKNTSIYGSMGNAAHDALENFYKGKLNHEGMLEYFEEKLFEFTIGGMKYDRSDEDKNKKIGDKYEECLRHFFLNHQKVPSKPKLEMFIPIKIGNYLIQGYIDFVHTEERVIKGETKPVMIVTDFKTSTIYKGDKAENEQGQLLLYGLGLKQKLKIPYEQIIVRWNFLKYVEVECEQAKGGTKFRTIERNKIGESLMSSAKMWLKKSKMKLTEEEIENYILNIIQTNSIDSLPEDVKDKFTIRDCYVEVPFTEKSVNELLENVLSMIAEIKEKEEEYKKTKDSKIWWKDVTDKDSYFLANLSGYSPKIHRPYKEYLDNLNLFRNDKGENENDENDIIQEIKDNDNETKIKNSNKNHDDDMSWLNDLLD